MSKINNVEVSAEEAKLLIDLFAEYKATPADPENISNADFVSVFDKDKNGKIEKSELPLTNAHWQDLEKLLRKSNLIPIYLVTTRTAGTKDISASFKIDPAALSTADFRTAIMDASSYPLTGTFMWTKVLEECRLVGKKGNTYYVYQKTGGAMGISGRHYVIAMRVESETADKVVIKWDLVDHSVGSDGTFSGPFESVLNASKDKYVYTPYNSGSWTYDRTTGEITYKLQNDAGGNLPDFLKNPDALLAFPKELLKTRFNIE